MFKYDKVSVRMSDGFQTLKNVSLELPDGSLTVVIGGSGAGKSSLINAGAGLKECDRGRVLIGGQDLSQMSEKSYMSFLRETVVLKKTPKLIERLSVSENIGLPLEIQGEKRKLINREVVGALEYVGLRHKELSSIKELNASQQLRIKLAQCLVRRPKYLLADDPTFHLSAHDFNKFRDFLYKIKDSGTTSLLVLDNTRACKFKDARMRTLWRGELAP